MPTRRLRLSTPLIKSLGLLSSNQPPPRRPSGSGRPSLLFSEYP